MTRFRWKWGAGILVAGLVMILALLPPNPTPREETSTA